MNFSFEIIEYNKSIVEILLKMPFSDDLHSQLKNSLEKKMAKPILGESKTSTEIPLDVFIKDHINENAHCLIEVSSDMLLELKLQRGVYRDHSILFMIFIDCTLATRLEQAKAESRYKTITMSIVSHELRTPVNAILGSLETITQYVPPEGQEFIELAKSSCYMLSFQINDLTDYGKVSDEKLAIDKTRMLLDEAVSECMSYVMCQIRSKGLTLNYIKNPSRPKFICANPRRFRQVLLNLLTNAIKFTEAGPIDIKPKVDMEKCELRLSVKDSGVGIKAEDLKKLFKEFAMLDSNRAMNPNGTGLGLYLSRRLMMQMNGDITVKSKYGHGSKFTIHIPLEPDAMRAKILPPIQSPDRNSIPIIEEIKNCDCVQVLVVDDTEANLVVIRGLFKIAKATCATAKSGPEAINLVKARMENKCCSRYKLIMMDFMMPGMNGLEATKAIKEVDPNCRVIGLTGESAEDASQEARNIYEEIVTKPISLVKLKSILNKYGMNV